MTTTSIRHRSQDELEGGLAAIRAAPKDDGVLEMIVRRPDVNMREVLEQGELDPARGLVGDRWSASRRPHPEMQLNLMSARTIALLTGDRARWPLAGDQLFVDLDLSVANLPPGTRLALGGAVIEITEPPHTGCGKFASRFGADAVKFVNSPEGRQLRLRGVNARIVTGGAIRVGGRIRKVAQ